MTCGDHSDLGVQEEQRILVLLHQVKLVQAHSGSYKCLEIATIILECTPNPLCWRQATPWLAPPGKSEKAIGHMYHYHTVGEASRDIGCLLRAACSESSNLSIIHSWRVKPRYWVSPSGRLREFSNLSIIIDQSNQWVVIL